MFLHAAQAVGPGGVLEGRQLRLDGERQVTGMLIDGRQARTEVLARVVEEQGGGHGEGAPLVGAHRDGGGQLLGDAAGGESLSVSHISSLRMESPGAWVPSGAPMRSGNMASGRSPSQLSRDTLPEGAASS